MKASETSTIAVLAEKPSVARDIARVLGADKRAEGYRSLLDEAGAPVGVQQKLMRHSKCRDHDERLWQLYAAREAGCEQQRS